VEGPTLLTTGEAAQRLGSSRQHVVDMCERGELPCVRVGKHRRVPEAAVRALVARASTSGLTRDQERSLWLHRVVAGRLLADPVPTMARARKNLEAWSSVHRRDGIAQHWLSRWGALLDGGVDAVADVLTSRDPQAVELRQNSPFAGVLDEQTRTRVLSQFARHWRREHADRMGA
jgi:excisionase family DNA binding protein